MAQQAVCVAPTRPGVSDRLLKRPPFREGLRNTALRELAGALGDVDLGGAAPFGADIVLDGGEAFAGCVGEMQL